MANNEGGRWDVGAKDNSVYVSRVSGDDEKVIEDLLSPEEARKIAGLLTKYADKAEESEKSDDTKESEGTKDSEKSEESDDSDDSKDSKDDEDSKESEKSDA